MWRGLEEDAIRIGLDLHYFWSLNVKQFMKHIKVYNQKEKERIQEIDSLNHVLGKYIGWAINDPKHYPKKPYSDKSTEPLRKMSIDEMEKQARINTMRMGGVINGNGR